jgi:hypothetical protein
VPQLVRRLPVEAIDSETSHFVDERLDAWLRVSCAFKHRVPVYRTPRQRVAEFADLAATAIAAAAHAEPIASRARIMAAADDARRRIGRDLHDGAQQRLVTLGLKGAQGDGSPAGRTRRPQCGAVRRCLRFDRRVGGQAPHLFFPLTTGLHLLERVTQMVMMSSVSRL